MGNFNLDAYALDGATSVVQFLIMLAVSLGLGLLVAWHYERYFPFVSRSQGMSKTLVSIALITTLVITVVKSSLALSLGLVGALSIVRFRTPIKEPFELAYIFGVIAIGLGTGAGQVFITLISIATLLIVLTFFSKKRRISNESVFFVYLTSKITSGSEKKSMEKIEELGQKLQIDLDVRRLDCSDDEERINLAVRIQSNEELNELKLGLEEYFSNANFSIVDGQRLVPF